MSSQKPQIRRIQIPHHSSERDVTLEYGFFVKPAKKTSRAPRQPEITETAVHVQRVQVVHEGRTHLRLLDEATESEKQIPYRSLLLPTTARPIRTNPRRSMPDGCAVSTTSAGVANALEPQKNTAATTAQILLFIVQFPPLKKRTPQVKTSLTSWKGETA